MSPQPSPRSRILHVAALLLVVLLPLQISVHTVGAASAGESGRSARSPKVFMKLGQHRVTTDQRATVKVALSAKGTRSATATRSGGLGTGHVKVSVVGGGKAFGKMARLSGGKVVVRLPRLPRGTYEVRARFLGNELLGAARSRARTMRVVRPSQVDDPGGPGGPADCASSDANVPDGSDGRGGCFPGVSNTGPNAPASSMSTYTGSCSITKPDVVIESKVVNCRTINVGSGASGFVLKNSYLNGGIIQSGGAAKFTVRDSFIDSGVQYPACSDGSCPAGKYACGDTGNATTDCGVTGSNFTIIRTEIINSNRAAYCESDCLIQDSYFHGTNLWPDRSNEAHASSVREEQGLTLRHNSLHCSYTGPFVNDEIGCSADLTGYPDFAPIKNNTVDGNLFVASSGSAYCSYGGATSGKPYSGDPSNATNQKFTNNVWQRGTNKKCGTYGPVTSFDKSRSGNVWSGNVWDDGKPVAPAM